LSEFFSVHRNVIGIKLSDSLIRHSLLEREQPDSKRNRRLKDAGRGFSALGNDLGYRAITTFLCEARTGPRPADAEDAREFRVNSGEENRSVMMRPGGIDFELLRVGFAYRREFRDLLRVETQRKRQKIIRELVQFLPRHVSVPITGSFIAIPTK
jgi:hypothetical protein